MRRDVLLRSQFYDRTRRLANHTIEKAKVVVWERGLFSSRGSVGRAIELRGAESCVSFYP